MTAAPFAAHVRRLATELCLEDAAELTCPPRDDRHPHAAADPLDDLILNRGGRRIGV